MKRRKVLKIILIVIAILVGIDLIAGYALMRFAIGSFSGRDESSEFSYSISDEALEAVTSNKERLYKLSAEWIEGSDVRQVSITADDGAIMHGSLVKNSTGSHLWVLLIHGYSRTRTRTYNYGMYYAGQGFNVLMPDMRGHGESGGNYVGMGWLDRKDILHWLDLIISEDPQAEIVMHGISMGAATVMMTAGEQIPQNVCAVVEDCGYTSVWDIFSDVLKDNAGIPEFPLLYTSELFGRIFAGYSFSEASSIGQLKKTTVPVLFIHGGCDTFVHTDMVYRLYDACPTEKDIYIAEEASHGQAMYLDPDKYFEKVFGFLGKYLSQP